jgi:2'-deoxynucleoside 5'-phosphate N-hydrolase
VIKIYFAGSILGGRQDKELYAGIIELLRQYGEVLTEHVGDPNEAIQADAELSDSEIYDRDMRWLLSADLVVAEVSTPSLGVGYELRVAEEKFKPALRLFREVNGRKLSAMVSGSRYAIGKFGPSVICRYQNDTLANMLGEIAGCIDDFIRGYIPLGRLSPPLENQ